MVTPSAQSLSKMLSTLTGVPVSCTPRPRFIASRAKSVFGIYNEMPEHDTILLRADLPLLASLGGSLIGLSDSLVAERIGASSTPLDKPLRDAIQEVLHSTSKLLSTRNRVVFKSMCTHVQYLTGPARSVLNSHEISASYNVTVQGYTGGQLSIFSDV